MPNYTYIINDTETSTRPAQYESDDAFIEAGGIIRNNDVDGYMYVHEIGFNYSDIPSD